MLRALLPTPHSGIPLSVLKNISFDWRAVAFSLQDTLRFVKASQGLQTIVWDGSGSSLVGVGVGVLLAPFLFLAASFFPAAGYLWDV